jgi:hypothetical protein
LNQSRAQLVILDPFGYFIEVSSPAVLSKSKVATTEELVLPTRDSRLLRKRLLGNVFTEKYETELRNFSDL